MSHIHIAAVLSSQLLLALTPLLILTTTLLTMALTLHHYRSIPNLITKVQNTHDFGQLCEIFGYSYETHLVTTPDGYILSLHRILPLNQIPSPSATLPVVFFQHGLLTNSEFFLVVDDVHRSLPFVLVNNGYDVWLGNNRGNKYSQKHTSLPISSPAFWNFSLDELAKYDLPCFISYILDHTNKPNLSYIGFSQGSAQAFAALSSNVHLNSKLNVLIALAPIIRPAGYASTYLDQLIKYNPSIIHTLFGNQAIFPLVSTIQRILPSSLLHFTVDTAVRHLLNFQNTNISDSQKRAGYTHIYCSSSVKSVVHWARIMSHQEFIPFPQSDDDQVRYPTEKITTPIVLVHGTSDSLFTLESCLERLPRSVTTFELEGYEHIDVLWGKNVHIDVVPKVLAVLRDRAT